MNKKYISIILIIFAVCLGLASFFIFTKKDKEIDKSNKDLTYSCDNLKSENVIDNWKTYLNKKDCYLIQYPENWHSLESFEHIGPYLAISDNLDNLNSQNPKIKVEIMNMQEFASFAVTLSHLKNVSEEYYWQGSQPAYKVSGEIDEDNNDDVIFSSFLIIPRENINKYVIVRYNKPVGEEGDDSYIINNILKSFDIED